MPSRSRSSRCSTARRATCPNTLTAQRTNPDDALAGADAIEAAILAEGAETVAAVYLEPVQNAGGCLVPPPGYFQRVREICDRHGVLLVSDEVICAFGRLGDWFGASRLGYQPDMITFAKGVTSGYSPLGGVLVSDRIAEPFLAEGTSFLHGITFAGHPVSCAVALANLDVMEREDLPGRVLDLENELRSHARDAHRPADRRRGARDGLLLRDRAHQGRRRLHRRRARLADPRVPLEAPARARADLPRPTTAAIR